MILKAYSILDAKVGVYSPPFFVQHDAYAMRLVARMAAEVDSTVSKFPEDFHLYRVGEFDDVCGMLTHVEFEPVCSVAAVLGGPKLDLGS